MTREEKVNLLNTLLEIEEKNDIGNLTRTDRREFQQWVEDLEQESILGKIRAKITNDIHKCNNTDMAFGMQHTLDVIDKYKEERSEKE